MIKPACSVSFLLSVNIFVWQNVLYFLDAPRRICLFDCLSDRELPKGECSIELDNLLLREIIN